MGFIKTAMYATLSMTLFYGGMRFQEYLQDDAISHLEQRLEKTESIDYKVRSLVEEYARAPEKVEIALKQYENHVRDE